MKVIPTVTRALVIAQKIFFKEIEKNKVVSFGERNETIKTATVGNNKELDSKNPVAISSDNQKKILV